MAQDPNQPWLSDPVATPAAAPVVTEAAPAAPVSVMADQPWLTDPVGAPSEPKSLLSQQRAELGMPETAPVDTGFGGALVSGLGQSVRDFQVGETDPSKFVAPNIVAAQPIEWANPFSRPGKVNDDPIDIRAVGEKVLYGLASSAPKLVGGLAGAFVGSAGGPVGTLAGGAAGTGIVAIAQSISPYYANELSKTPDDADGAFDRALGNASIDGVVNAGSWAAFGGFNPFKGAVKNIIAQSVVTQPAIQTAGQVAHNALNDRPLMEGAVEGYPGAVASTMVPAFGHMAVGSIPYLADRAAAPILKARRAARINDLYDTAGNGITIEGQFRDLNDGGAPGLPSPSGPTPPPGPVTPAAPAAPLSAGNIQEGFTPQPSSNMAAENVSARIYVPNKYTKGAVDEVKFKSEIDKAVYMAHTDAQNVEARNWLNTLGIDEAKIAGYGDYLTKSIQNISPKDSQISVPESGYSKDVLRKTSPFESGATPVSDIPTGRDGLQSMLEGDATIEQMKSAEMEKLDRQASADKITENGDVQLADNSPVQFKSNDGELIEGTLQGVSDTGHGKVYFIEPSDGGSPISVFEDEGTITRIEPVVNMVTPDAPSVSQVPENAIAEPQTQLSSEIAQNPNLDITQSVIPDESAQPPADVPQPPRKPPASSPRAPRAPRDAPQTQFKEPDARPDITFAPEPDVQNVPAVIENAAPATENVPTAQSVETVPVSEAATGIPATPKGVPPLSVMTDQDLDKEAQSKNRKRREAAQAEIDRRRPAVEPQQLEPDVTAAPQPGDTPDTPSNVQVASPTPDVTKMDDVDLVNALMKPETKEAAQQEYDRRKETNAAAARAKIDAKKSEVDQAADQAVEPTDAQKEAGNYKKGHVRIHGLDVTIEIAKGNDRKGVSKDGKEWSVPMPDHYGYIKRTEGADGENVDVYVGSNPDSDRAFIIDQVHSDTRSYDEHKVMLGYDDPVAARAAYVAAFSDGKGEQRIGAFTETSVAKFKEWLNGPDTSKPWATWQNIPDESQAETLEPPAQTLAPRKVRAYRGEHGVSDSEFHTRLPTISFGSEKAATTYANYPNNREDKAAVSPRVRAYDIEIKKPIIDQTEDPFIDVSVLIDAIGRENSAKLAEKFAGQIQDTNNWEENFSPEYDSVSDLLKKSPEKLGDLYFDIYQMLDDPEAVSMLKAAGYDGAIHGGNGETALETEYRIFDAAQATRIDRETPKPKPKAKKPFATWQNIPEELPTETLEPVAQTLGPKGTEFKTSKGSSYIFDGGQTTRNKAARNDVGHEGDQGVKPRSDLTVFLKKEDAPRLAQPSGHWAYIDHGDGKMSLATKNDDGQWGISPTAKQIDVSFTPSIGDMPLELWNKTQIYGRDAYTKAHFGNDIVSIGSETHKAEPETPKPAAETPKPKPKAKKRKIDLIAALEAYFEPGKEIKSYGGGVDTVVSFDPGKDGNWSVTVKGEDGRVRNHATLPDMKLLEKALDDLKDKLPPAETTTPEPETIAAGSETEPSNPETPTDFPESQAEKSRKAKLKDVGEKMRGKRAQDVEAINTIDDAAQFAKKIIKATGRSDLFPIDVSETATSGTEAYVQAVREQIRPFSDFAFNELLGVSIYRGKTFEQQLVKNFGRESGEAVKRRAAAYIEALPALAAVFQEAQSVSDAKRALWGLLVLPDYQDDAAVKIKDDYLSPLGLALKPMLVDKHKGRYTWSGIERFFHDGLWPGGMKDHAEAKKANTRENKLIRPKLEMIVRENMDAHRTGDVTPEDFKDRFGFRGVEFGNWVNAAEGQAHLNQAYDALSDFAAFLDIKPEHISLGGKLGFAFGSRGSGEHAAHFEPGNMVINLTKTKGDGSVAHEWLHALDHVLRKEQKANLAMGQIVQRLKYKPHNIEYAEKQIKEFLRGTTYYQTYGPKKPIENAKVFLDQLQMRGPSSHRMTRFFNEAQKLGKDYWGNDKEILARAFEGYVYDRLGGTSPYLVSNWVADGNVTQKSGYRGTPYAEADERQEFNSLFDDLFKVIKFSDSGPALEGAISSQYKDLFDWSSQTRPKLDTMLKEVQADEFDKRRVPTSISAVDAGQSTGYDEAAESGRDVRPARSTDDGGGNGTLRSDLGKSDSEGRKGERGAGGGSKGSRVQRDDTVPDDEYTPEDVGQLEAADVTGDNYVIRQGALDEKRGPKRKAEDNIAAIKLLKELEAEGRAATQEEQSKLALYVGWGGVKNAFRAPGEDFKEGWSKVGTQLESMLTEQELAIARRTIQYAHYTSEVVVRGIWTGLKNMGFEGGAIFEPGMGIGNFPGMMPENMAAKSTYSGIELDPLTARIAMKLFPEHSVRNGDFTTFPLPDSTFDLAIGNPPFSDRKVRNDPKYPSLSLHDYFFAKSLDAVAPGGMVAFVTSHFSLDKIDPAARVAISEKADLVGAIRLPNTAFKTNANTEVTTDVIFLRKRKEGEEKGNTDWTLTQPINLTKSDGNEGEAHVNKYFVQNPWAVLGDQAMTGSMYGKDEYTVNPTANFDLEQALGEAVNRLPSNIFTGADRVDTGNIDYPVEQKIGSYYLKDGELYQVGDDRLGVPAKIGGRGAKENKEKIKKLIPLRDALRVTHKAMQTGGDVKAAQKEMAKHYDAFVKKYGPLNITAESYRRPSPAALEEMRTEARNDALLGGEAFDEGDADLSRALDMRDEDGKKKYTNTMIAKQRQQLRDKAAAEGRPFNEGSFDPENVPDIVNISYPNLDPFIEDPEYYNLMILEDYNADTKEAKKTAIFEKNIFGKMKEPKIETITDALNYSLNVRNKVDIDFISDTSGEPRQQVITELVDQNIIFEQPTSESYDEEIWLTAEEYLSGNVKRKLKEAKDAAALDDRYGRNVAALTAIQPKDVPISEIRIGLGSPMLNANIVADFSRHALDIFSDVEHYPTLHLWKVSPFRGIPAEATVTYGTGRINAFEIIENLLNGKEISIRDTLTDIEGKKTSVPNIQETEAANEKANAIKDKFDAWIWKSEYGPGLHRRYNDDYNNTVHRVYNGAHLTPAHSPTIELRRHQKNFVWRVLQDGNAYAAHAVGAGKTLELVVSGMEGRRLGVIKKPLYVVPNHMLGQFQSEFRMAYPEAKILIADEHRFHKDRRQGFVAQAAKGDWDAIIMTFSSFKAIPVSIETETEMTKRELERYEKAIIQMKAAGQKKTLSGIEKGKEKIVARLKALSDQGKKDQSITFEMMGIDFAFVDEAHEYRRLSFSTSRGRVRGVQPEGSAAAWDFFMKTRYLETIKPGRNLVLASGTPLTNTIAEAFTLLRYMNEKELAALGLDDFDSWANMFANTVSYFEKQPSGKYAQVSRLAQFLNIPALSGMIRKFMDVVVSDDLGKIVDRPTIETGNLQVELAKPTRAFKEYQKVLEARMEAIKNRGKAQKGDDIILSIINDGRHAAIDMRMIDPTLLDQDSKLNLMIDNVFRIWKETKDNVYNDAAGKPMPIKGATQLIFSDLGVKKKEKDGMSFSAYDWMKKKLIMLGVPKDEILFRRDLGTHEDKRRADADMRAGKIRIQIGATSNMGTGLNVQNRLKAVHNLDAPWIPADLEQRKGRAHRQGNQNKEIGLYGYGTVESYDSTMWGLLDIKSQFINSFLKGEVIDSEADDIDESTNQFRIAQALTTGDRRVIRRAELLDEIGKLERKEKAFHNQQFAIAGKLGSAEARIKFRQKRIDEIEAVLPQRVAVAGDKFSMLVNGVPFKERVKAGEALMAQVKLMVGNSKSYTSDGVKVGELAGFEVRYYRDSNPLVADQNTLFLETPISDDYFVSYGEKGRDALGIIRALETAPLKFEAKIAEAKSDIESSERDIRTLKSEQAGEFPQQQKLADLRQELAGIEDSMQKEQAVVEIEEPEGSISGHNSAEIVHDEDEPKYYADLSVAAQLSDNPDIAKVQKSINDRLKALGWPSLNVTLNDGASIDTAPGLKSDRKRNIRGTYMPRNSAWGGVITLAMAPDVMKILDHEFIHALKDAGAFSKGEWNNLRASAKRWRVEYNIDARYRDLGLSEEDLDEEAIADAMKDFGQQAKSGWLKRIFNRTNRFLGGVKSAVEGNGFQTAEDVLAAVQSGKIGRRAEKGLQMPSDRDMRVRFALGDAENADDALEEAEESLDRLQRRVRGASDALPDDLGIFAATLSHPHQIASYHEDFTPVYVNAISQYEYRDQMISQLSEKLDPYSKLPVKSKDRVNAVLELGRLDGKTFSTTEGTVRVTNEKHPKAEFTKVGDEVRLSARETTAYYAVRKAMDQAIKLRILQILDDYELEGKKFRTSVALFKHIETVDDNEKKRLLPAAQQIQELETMMRRGYVPFTRFGNIAVVVKERGEAGSDPRQWTTAYFTKIDAGDISSKIQRVQKRIKGGRKLAIGDYKQVREVIKQLDKEYPADRYQISAFPTGAPVDLLGKLRLSDIEMLVESTNLRPEEYQPILDGIERAQKARGHRAHFFKADNIPGYTADFERAIASYVVTNSGFLSRMRYGPRIEKAIGKIPQAKTRLVRYAQKYMQYLENPQEEFQLIRQINFVHFIAGSLASGLTNLTQVPMVSAPFLAMFKTKQSPKLLLTNAYADAFKMVSIKEGLEIFDVEKAPKDIKREIKDAFERGVLLPLDTFQMMGTVNTNNAAMRGIDRKIRKGMDAAAITFTAAERLNRLVTFIASVRLAKEAGAKTKIRSVLQRDALFRKTVLSSGGGGKGGGGGGDKPPTSDFPDDPEEPEDDDFASRFAEFATMSTQFRMSKNNRPTIMRGIGAALFQFMGYSMQILEFMGRMSKIYGKSGKIGTLKILGFTAIMAGYWGLPFAQDAKKVIEWLYHSVTKRDLDLETALREFFAKFVGSKVSEAMAKGAPRALPEMLAIDMSGRLGLGNIVPDMDKGLPGMMMFSFYQEAGNMIQYASAGRTTLMLAEVPFAPKGLSDLLRGYDLGQSGAISLSSNDATIGADQITAADVVKKSIGFRSAKIANKQEQIAAVNRARRAVSDLQSSFYDRLAVSMSASIRANQHGDTDTAKMYTDKTADIFKDIQEANEGTDPSEMVTINRKSLQNRVREELGGADTSKGPKKARARQEQIKAIYGTINQHKEVQ